jgi:purine-nucleoside phosphorylase
MMIKDHINLPGFTGAHPLKGPNDDRFGGRFFALNNCYDQNFRRMAQEVVTEIGIESSFHEGVYAMLAGPNYETVAELRMLKTCGIDAVGMSTIPEVLVASHCGIRVFAFSLITNSCKLEEGSTKSANHEEVLQAAKKKETDVCAFASKVVQGIHDLTTKNQQNFATI